MAVSLDHPDTFVRRHVGPREAEERAMLAALGLGSLDDLVRETVPEPIRLGRALDLEPALSESALLDLARSIGAENEVHRSLIGMGYSGCITPPVIQRNILENPGWYTQYTPYQAEIAQGRLEALLNFQTMVSDLTGLEIANASLLDEATAAAEAMHLAHAFRGGPGRNTFVVSEWCHPQVIEVVETRARAIGVDVVVVDPFEFPNGVPGGSAACFGVMVQYPDTLGRLRSRPEYEALAKAVHDAGALFVMAADLLALALVVSPGELGADIALGSSQRFGVPLGYGGPHAAFFATRQELVRKLPGRIIGVSEDASGKPALRMALQTREQHIRREKATSNICTAQALLAVTASMYAVYHGPDGIQGIARMVHGLAATLASGLERLGLDVTKRFFDTVAVIGTIDEATRFFERALARRINLRRASDGTVSVSLDELSTPAEVQVLLEIFGGDEGKALRVEELAAATDARIPASLARTSPYLTHPVFSAHRSETAMLRYMRRLESRDLSLVHSMIPLGSCTMKLNATAEMMPVTAPEWNRLHPFAPVTQAKGYARIVSDLERMLAEITGFAGVSLQPNAGAQGEYAGLLAIRKYHECAGQGQRRVCLIPSSAHGTNPASAVMAGLEVVVVACDARGNVDVAELDKKAREHAPRLSALMITYPSTHGVFEEEIKRICAIVHEHGGQVYMDGANMNAQVGLTRPADIGADVCHINLHKTFCIPHGGGGPGMGPIGVAPHLVKHLPRLPVLDAASARTSEATGPVSAAPWGSASILLISWAYIRMMGADGLKRATEVAILNANYIAARLAGSYEVVYRGKNGRVAHECILDVRPFKKSAGIEVDDIAKRLQDYGFHAPTMSFPIPGTLMVEPTESEAKGELDRFCEAMLAIRKEIEKVETGAWPRADNPLKNAPHTVASLAGEWSHPYTREEAAFPAPWTREGKFFSYVGRLNNAYGDRNLVCTCPPVEAYGE